MRGLRRRDGLGAFVHTRSTCAQGAFQTAAVGQRQCPHTHTHTLTRARTRRASRGGPVLTLDGLQARQQLLQLGLGVRVGALGAGLGLLQQPQRLLQLLLRLAQRPLELRLLLLRRSEAVAKGRERETWRRGSRRRGRRWSVVLRWWAAAKRAWGEMRAIERGRQWRGGESDDALKAKCA